MLDYGVFEHCTDAHAGKALHCTSHCTDSTAAAAAAAAENYLGESSAVRGLSLQGQEVIILSSNGARAFLKSNFGEKIEIAKEVCIMRSPITVATR